MYELLMNNRIIYPGVIDIIVVTGLQYKSNCIKIFMSAFMRDLTLY